MAREETTMLNLSRLGCVQCQHKMPPVKLMDVVLSGMQEKIYIQGQDVHMDIGKLSYTD